MDKVKKSQPTNLCAKHLDKAYYKGLEGEDRETFYKCVKTGIENPDSGMGCYAMTPAGEDRAFELAATNPPVPPPPHSRPSALPPLSATQVEPPSPLLLLCDRSD